MATVASRVRAGEDRYFYVWMAFACLVIAFGAFTPTYWYQIAEGTFVGQPLLHLHAILFSAWTLLLLGQTWLVAQGRVVRHRGWGMAGISLATAMLLVGFATAVDSAATRYQAGFGDRALGFLLLPLSAMVFAGFFAAALLNLRRPEWHKRFMLVATASLLQAAVARLFFLAHAGAGPGLRPGLAAPPPVSSGLYGGLAVDLIILAGMIHDRRRRGQVHRAWLVGLGVMLTVQILRGPLSLTPAWLGIARALTGIG